MSSDEQPELPVRIWGGTGGHFAVTEDLVHASWVLEGAAAEVDEAARQLRMAAFWLERARPDAVAGVGGAITHAHGEVEKALSGHDGAYALAEDLAGASVRVAEVARAYETADGQAEHHLGAAQWWGQAASVVLRTATAPLRIQTGVSLKVGSVAMGAMASGAGLMAMAQDARAPALGLGAPWRSASTAFRWSGGAASTAGDAVLPNASGPITRYLNAPNVAALLGTIDGSMGRLPTGYERTAGMISVAISLLERIAGEPRYTGVVPRIGSQQEVAAATGVADLIADLGGIDPGGPGAIVIDTTVLPNGTKTHVVRVPGTRDNWVADRSTFDYGSNVAAIVGKESDSERLLMDALKAAGIGADEPIMLVGHSQGGIIAAKVAASAGADYNITHVTTVGSPTDRLEYVRGIEYLNVRHDEDLVHGLDGKPPPDLPHVTTVMASLEQAEQPWLVSAAGGIASSHAVTAYVATGRAIDASKHASVEAWRASASDYLGGGKATRKEYAPTFCEPAADTAERVPESTPTSRPQYRSSVLPALPGRVSLPDALSPQLPTTMPMPTGNSGISDAWFPRSLP